jgi:protein-disulfide isomerase
MSRQHKTKHKPQPKKDLTKTWIIVGVALLVIAIGVAFFWPNSPKPLADIKVPPADQRTQQKFNSMGNPNAPVKIVEYSDYQCPYCGNFSKDTEPQIEENYVKSGKVYFTYRSFGNWISDNINQSSGTNSHESADAAAAAYCAGDQNKYWEYHDILFANQNGEDAGVYIRVNLDAFAEKLGLDMTAFKSCMDSKKYDQMVVQDLADGQNAINSAPNYDKKGFGTPAFLVNGKLIMGAEPFSTFKTEIDAALKAAGK